MVRSDVVIVGAGFAGLYMLHRTRELGLTAVVIEKAPDLGGTWYWNAYPGARCDVPSLRYSYSFDETLQDEWQWSEKYATQPEILRYIQHVADRFDLRSDIRFNETVNGAVYDEDTDRWLVRSDYQQYNCQFLVAATGALSSASTGDFPHRDEYTGRIHRTSSWPHQGVDVKGRSVIVVGTGSSGIQVIPELAKDAAHLVVLQRTPNFSVPAYNGPIDPTLQAQVREDYPGWRATAYLENGCRNTTRDSTASFATTSPAALAKVLDDRWAEGGAAFLGPFPEILTDLAVNKVYSDYVKARIHDAVPDRATADLLASQTFPIGTKRICVDTGYYDTFNRSTVRLKDVRTDPIVSYYANGIRTESEEIQADVIVLATGFDAMTGSFTRLGVTGRDGKALAEVWADGPRTYLGVQTAGFPNFFMIAGPGSPSVLSNMVCSIEQHVEFVIDLIASMRSAQLSTVEPSADAQDAWTDHVADVASQTLYPTAASWYMGANIPGKKRIFMPYVGSGKLYAQRLDATRHGGWPGFDFDENPVGRRSTAVASYTS